MDQGDRLKSKFQGDPVGPSESRILAAIKAGTLPKVLRGEECVFTTPSSVNGDMRPTDHAELLEFGLYPIARELGASFIQGELEKGLRAICVDALGVFCAHQCFYVELVNEKAGLLPLRLDRGTLPKYLAISFLREASGLHSLDFLPGDLANDRPYRITLAVMRILARDYDVEWGVALPPL